MPLLSKHPPEIVVSCNGRIIARCLLRPGTYTAGQDRASSIMLEEASISSSHALLTFSEEGWLSLQDLGSSNGTFVNDQLANSPVLIGPGDTIRLGGCTLKVRIKHALRRKA